MSNKSTAATVKDSLTTGDRERFEHWASDDGESPKAVERVGDCYRLAQTQASWMAWHKCSTENPAIAVIDAQAAEIERLREALGKEAGWHDDQAKNYRARREFTQTPVSDGLLAEWHKQRAQSIRAALSGEPT